MLGREIQESSPSRSLNPRLWMPLESRLESIPSRLKIMQPPSVSTEAKALLETGSGRSGPRAQPTCASGAVCASGRLGLSSQLEHAGAAAAMDASTANLGKVVRIDRKRKRGATGDRSRPRYSTNRMVSRKGSCRRHHMGWLLQSRHMGSHLHMG